MPRPLTNATLKRATAKHKTSVKRLAAYQKKVDAFNKNANARLGKLQAFTVKWQTRVSEIGVNLAAQKKKV